MQMFTWIVKNFPIRYDSTQISLRQSKYNGAVFWPLTYNVAIYGRKYDLTWSHRYKKSEIYVFVGIDDFIIFRKFHNFP